MKYVMMLLVLVLVGCATERDLSRVYPHCLKYPANPDVPFEEFMAMPQWWGRVDRDTVLSNCWSINLDYPGQEVWYINELLRRGKLSRADYVLCMEALPHSVSRR